MRDVKRLAIVIADDNRERFRTGLAMAAAHVALGGEVRLFFQGAAVAVLRRPVDDPEGYRHSAAGLPTLAQLYEEALGLGVHFAACQSGLALLGLSALDFDPDVEWIGMVGFLSAVEPRDQLIVI